MTEFHAPEIKPEMIENLFIINSTGGNFNELDI